MCSQIKLTRRHEAASVCLGALGERRLVCRGLLANLRKVEDPLPGTAGVDGVGEQRLVVVRPDEPGVAILLEEQEVHVLSGFVVGVPEFMSLENEWREIISLWSP